MADTLADMTSQLRLNHELIVNQHEELREDHTIKTNNVKYQVHDVDQSLADLKDRLSNELMTLKTEVDRLSYDNRVSSEILRDSMYRLCADVSALRGSGALSREMLMRREGDDVPAACRGILSSSSVVLAGQDVGVTSHGQRGTGSMTSVVGSDDFRSGGDYGPVTVTARTVLLKK